MEEPCSFQERRSSPKPRWDDAWNLTRDAIARRGGRCDHAAAEAAGVELVNLRRASLARRSPSSTWSSTRASDTSRPSSGGFSDCVWGTIPGAVHRRRPVRRRGGVPIDSGRAVSADSGAAVRPEGRGVHAADPRHRLGPCAPQPKSCEHDACTLTVDQLPNCCGHPPRLSILCQRRRLFTARRVGGD